MVHNAPEFDFPYSFLTRQANGLRYTLVGGTRQRHFVGTNFKPRKLPKNAQTPTSRVHALLGNLDPYQNLGFQYENKTPKAKVSQALSSRRFISSEYSMPLLSSHAMAISL